MRLSWSGSRCGAVWLASLMLWMGLSPCHAAEEELAEADRSADLDAMRFDEASMIDDAEAPEAGHSADHDPDEPIRVSMDFKDAELKNVLKVFSQQTGVNVIATDEISEKPMTLYLEEVAPMDALDRILQSADLTFERPAGSDIYLIKAQPESEQDAGNPFITRVYRLKFARVSTSRLAVATEAFGAITPFESARSSTLSIGSGDSSEGSGGGATFAGGGGAGGGQRRDVGVDKVLEEVLTERGNVVVDERTNSVIVSDVEDNFPRIESVLKALDVRTAQILIESEVLETGLSKLKDLGIEWGTGSEGNMATLTPGSRSTRFPFAALGEGIAPTLSDGRFSTTTLSAASAVGTLQALERDTNTKILARPKILTLDNESALIRLTTLQAVGFETTTGQQTETTSVTPERATTGVILVVTPQVNEDGYITMLVEPSVTKVSEAQVTPPSGTGTVVDPKTRSARALVRIRTGDTLVLGGLIDRDNQYTVRRVPLLASIPVFGEAFKNRETTNSATELVIFITPRIVSEPHDVPAAQVAKAAPVVMPGEMREQTGSDPRHEEIERSLAVMERRALNQ